MLTLNRLRRLEAALRRRGHGSTIEWSEIIQPPIDGDAFAEQAVYVICNSGMRVTIAEPIYRRCMAALRAGEAVSGVFGHPGKVAAIEHVWQGREAIYLQYLQSEDPIAFLQTLPWIGPVVRYHLAKNLGADVAKPDVHLERLARRDRTTTAKLCRRLAHETGYRVATVDSILWRACADGLLNSRVYESHGWAAAISAEITSEAWRPPTIESPALSPDTHGDDPTA